MPNVPNPTAAQIAAGVAVVAAGCLVYAAGYEVQAYRLRRVDVPVLPAGQRPLRTLHVSDLHMTPAQNRKREWVRSLDGPRARLGRQHRRQSGAQASIRSMCSMPSARCCARPGVFVLGSNDYYAPVLKNPARYLLRSNRPSGRTGRTYRGTSSGTQLRGAGWLDLTNSRGSLDYRRPGSCASLGSTIRTWTWTVTPTSPGRRRRLTSASA